MNPPHKRDANWNESVEKPFIPAIEIWGRKLIYRLASIFIRSIASRGVQTSQFSFQNVKRILVIKEPYRMGDLIQITPTLRALKECSPHLQIGLLIQERNLPVFKYNPDISEIFVYKKKEFNRCPWKLIPFIRDIRKKQFDLAVTLETQRTHLTNDILAFLSGSPYTLRYDGGVFGNEESNCFYNLLSPYDPKPLHEVDKNFNVFAPFGLRMDDRRLVLQISNQDNEKAGGLLKSLTGSDSVSVVIHPGSYKVRNRWPLGHYLEAGEKIRKKGKSVLFILGPAEEDWQEEIEKEKFPLLSKITITEMAGIFKRSKTVLCNDTGVMHIAAAVGAQVTALFGETDPLQWRPPGDSVTVIQNPDRKISSIGVKQVLDVLSAA